MKYEAFSWSPQRRMTYNAICRGIFHYLGMYIDELEVYGLENVPASGPFIAVSNHVHISDPNFHATLIPRPMHFMAKRSLFQIPLIGFGMRLLNAIPVDRDGRDIPALRAALSALDKSRPIFLYPEGTRSPTASLQPPQPGAGYLAVRAGVPILPIAISGTENISFGNFSNNTAVRVSFTVGSPFELNPPFNFDLRESSEWAGLEMMRRIASMLPVSYRGVFSDDPLLVTTGGQRHADDDIQCRQTTD
tara:strand:- start:413 stop:1156 length:744 start_codon:yes stop_codon:yes gene_type:complete